MAPTKSFNMITNLVIMSMFVPKTVTIANMIGTKLINNIANIANIIANIIVNTIITNMVWMMSMMV